MKGLSDNQKEILNLLSKGFNMVEIADYKKVSKQAIFKVVKRLRELGIYNYNRNFTKEIITPEGYILVNHNGKYLLKHKLVYEEIYGKIPVNFVIHHLNLNKRDNRLSNLILLSNSEHKKLHSLLDKNLGNFTLKLLKELRK